MDDVSGVSVDFAHFNFKAASFILTRKHDLTSVTRLPTTLAKQHGSEGFVLVSRCLATSDDFGHAETTCVHTHSQNETPCAPADGRSWRTAEGTLARMTPS